MNIWMANYQYLYSIHESSLKAPLFVMFKLALWILYKSGEIKPLVVVVNNNWDYILFDAADFPYIPIYI